MLLSKLQGDLSLHTLTNEGASCAGTGTWKSDHRVLNTVLTWTFYKFSPAYLTESAVPAELQENLHLKTINSELTAGMGEAGRGWFVFKFPGLNFPFPHMKLSPVFYVSNLKYFNLVLILSTWVFLLALTSLISRDWEGSFTAKPCPITVCEQEAPTVAMASSDFLPSPEKNYPKRVCKPPRQSVILEIKNPPLEQMVHSGFSLVVNEVTGCFFCRKLWSRGFQMWTALFQANCIVP